jgi:hypothetical protein
MGLTSFRVRGLSRTPELQGVGRIGASLTHSASLAQGESSLSPPPVQPLPCCNPTQDTNVNRSERGKLFQCVIYPLADSSPGPSPAMLLRSHVIHLQRDLCLGTGLSVAGRTCSLDSACHQIAPGTQALLGFPERTRRPAYFRTWQAKASHPGRMLL